MQNIQSDHKTILDELKEEQIAKIKQRHADKILEKENAEFLTKLIENAEYQRRSAEAIYLRNEPKMHGHCF